MLVPCKHGSLQFFRFRLLRRDVVVIAEEDYRPSYARYRVCAASGTRGPKTRLGDKQVPEGFYRIDAFRRASIAYLSMRINYPNRRDRQVTARGGAVMIHGHCISDGCLAMGDDRIQELWVMARATKRRVRVHIYPQRNLRSAIADKQVSGKVRRLWRSLRKANDYFVKHRRVPKMWIQRGRYMFPR